MQFFRAFCLAACLAALGCKHDSTPAAAATGPDGIYAGTLTSSNQNATYSVIGAVNEAGLLQLINVSTNYQYSGQLTLNGSAASSTLQVFDNTGKPVTTGTLSASVSAHSQIVGSYTLATGETGSLILAYNGQYANPTSLAAVAGSYRWTSTRNGGASTLTFNADGTLSGTTEYGCSFTGTATIPDASYDLFNVTLTATAGNSACGTAAGATLTGLAYYIPLHGTTPSTLVSAATNQTLGTFASYQRQ